MCPPTTAPLSTRSGIALTNGGIAFSRDGKRLATTRNENIAKVWEAATGHELFTLAGSTGKVLGVAFSPDGNRLASANDDNTARVYPAPIDELPALACSRLTRTWTADDCKVYLQTDTCPLTP
jgi:WD40 repeat protein